MIYLIHASLFGLFYGSQADGKSHTFIPWLVITFTPWPWQVPKLEVLYHTCIFFYVFLWRYIPLHSPYIDLKKYGG